MNVRKRTDLATKQEIAPSIDLLVAEWLLGGHNELSCECIVTLERASAELKSCLDAAAATQR